jgi:hypothetical protein
MSEPLTFVCWRWQPKKAYRSTFAPETVYALKAMIERHYHTPHRFVCVTDQPEQLRGIETIRLWDDCSQIPSPIGHSYPSCYRRLKVFAPDAGQVFGPRLVSIDLDTVIVGDITPLFDRPEDFVIWGESDFPHTTPYCGSLWMLRTGTRTKVWTAFDPETSPRKAWQAGCRGSDQGFISYILGRDEATWGRKHGVYSYRKHIAQMGNRLPEDARMVSFHGKVDPWSYKAQQIPWVREHYNLKAVAA